VPNASQSIARHDADDIWAVELAIEFEIIPAPGKPSSDTHDQIRKITLKTTTAKTKTFNRKSLVYVFGRKR
jgi:hypothetical protein